MRPASGIGTGFGGTGSRASITHSGTQWANLALINPSSGTVPPGGDFSASYYYNSFGHSATVTWYLDPDTNPYNGNSIAITTAATLPSTGVCAVLNTVNLTANAVAGELLP